MQFLLIRSQSIVSSAQVEKTDTFSFVKWYGQSDGGGLGCFTGVQKNCSWYYTASLFHDNPFLYHPCMVYLPACSWFLWEKWEIYHTWMLWDSKWGIFVVLLSCSSSGKPGNRSIYYFLPVTLCQTGSGCTMLHCSKGISTPLKLSPVATFPITW